MSTRKRKNFDDLIEQAGSRVHLAAALGIGEATVISWLKRNGIPLTYWPELIQLYKLDPQDLLDINQQIWAENREKTK